MKRTAIRHLLSAAVLAAMLLAPAIASAQDYAVWAYRANRADGWTPCNILYVSSRFMNPRMLNNPQIYELVTTGLTRREASQLISRYSMHHDDRPDFVVKMRTCKPRREQRRRPGGGGGGGATRVRPHSSQWLVWGIGNPRGASALKVTRADRYTATRANSAHLISRFYFNSREAANAWVCRNISSKKVRAIVRYSGYFNRTLYTLPRGLGCGR